MIRKLLRATCLFLLGSSLALTANAQKITVQHASGNTGVSLNPKKVVVLDLSALDTLDALNIPVTGVPNWKLPPDLARYEGKQYLKMGSLFDPDYEAVNAAAPDLIIIGARMRKNYAQLSKIAPTIDLSLDANDFYASVEHNARILGQIFTREAEVEQHLARLKESTARLRQQASKAGRSLIVMTTGGKISAYGKGSRFGAMHDQFGLQAADPNIKPATHGQAISYEYILKTNPDWLLVVDRDGAIGSQGKAAAQLLDNPLVAQTRAWRQKQVVYLDPAHQYITSGGLRAEQAIVDALSAALKK